jgi:hypothetical protein
MNYNTVKKGYLQYIWLFVTLGKQWAVETLGEVETQGAVETLLEVEKQGAVGTLEDLTIHRLTKAPNWGSDIKKNIRPFFNCNPIKNLFFPFINC